MLLLRYLLMFIGIGLLAGAAGILVWDLYQILKLRKIRATTPGEGSTSVPELLEPAPAISWTDGHWQAAKRVAIWGIVPLLAGMSIAVVPSGSAGGRVNQFVGTRPATLYPGVHFILPLIESMEIYSVRDEVFATTLVEDPKKSKGEGTLRVQTREGAAARHAGKFEQAHKGTLFLDEIGDMPAAMQAKLLRVLEEGEIERVGGSGAQRVDVRVVTATHRNLEEQVRAGAFRQDLFHRIFVFPVQLPPLRERKDDIAALVEHFNRSISEMNGWKLKPFTEAAVAALQHHAWPGNVRELRNAVERLLLLADLEVGEEDVRLALPQIATAAKSSGALSFGTLATRTEAFERETIRAELERSHHSMTEAARALGLERSHLYKKCAQLGIDIKSLRRPEE